MTECSPPPYIVSPRPRRILIIGGGAAGLAALKVLVEEGGDDVDGPFERVSLIERRDNIGGVWHLDDRVAEEEKTCSGGSSFGQWPVQLAVPPEGRSNGQTKDLANRHSNGVQYLKPFWPSPAYAGLRGNVLPRFLTFAGGPLFPPVKDSDDPFPTLSETQDYLELVAQPLRGRIRCNIECIEVRELPGSQEGCNRWAVRLRDWSGHCSIEYTEYYDAVVLTVGWTDTPTLPNIDGLKEARLKGLIDHCKWYRGPESYGRDSRVVVVGNANSGNDIAAQLAGQRVQGQHDRVYRVARHKAWDYIVSLEDPMIQDVPALKKLIVVDDSNKVDVELVDGSTLKNIDRVIFASGYQVAKIGLVHLLDRQPYADEVPYLQPGSNLLEGWTFSSFSSANSPWKPLTAPPDGTSFNATDNPPRIPHLFWQFVHARASTLAMINICPTRIPFWTANVQAHCLRAIWDGSMTSFPFKMEDRLQYESNRLELLARLKREEPARLQKSSEQAKMLSTTDSYQPPLHNATPSYHSLGLAIDDYGPPLRRMAISAKPEWQNKLPDWDLHAEERITMHELRLVALQKRRERGIKAN